MTANNSPARRRTAASNGPKLIKLKSSGKAVERVELFSIDDVPYSVPVKVSTSDGLAYSELLLEQGEVAAGTFMLKKMIGQEGWDALKNWPDLEDEHLELILEAIHHIVLGSSEDPKA